MILVLLLFSAAVSVFATGAQEEAAAEGDVIAVEYWNENSQYGMIDADHPQSVAFAEQFGIVFDAPQVPWNGGTDYLQQLRLRIASGDLPDVFMPWGGIEAELIENGAVADLTGLVQEEMPVYYNSVPTEVWDFVRSLSPDGESIYVLPAVQFTPLGAMIRGDWLDRLGLEVPTTVDEYVAVMEAFRDQDANGNGDPNDELPVSGREGGRWMDHLFAPFGIAMREGFPEWDIYDGELQYSAVQPEMKAAIEWIRGLYADGLLDPETFINTGSVRQAKVTGDLAGSWYHGLHWADGRFAPLYNSGITEVRFDYLPVLEHPDFDGFLTTTDYRRPGNVFSAEMSEEAIRRTMRALEWLNDPANLEDVLRGWEGLTYLIEDGQEVRLNLSDFQALGTGYRWVVQPQLFANVETQIGGNEFAMDLVNRDGSAGQEAVYQGLATENKLVDAYADDIVRSIAGQFVPPSVYEGFPDIRTHRLYQEYMSKIIVGEWDIDRFDEFVERWYESGGTEVTERAQAAYEALQ
jgi:putative aldouronate transport system substrate-binding protein